MSAAAGFAKVWPVSGDSVAGESGALGWMMLIRASDGWQSRMEPSGTTAKFVVPFSPGIRFFSALAASVGGGGFDVLTKT
ncbi:MAG: hypothetical protein BWY82_01319 [Verrucomicrobia bacterium ADurb.Bin474]|nr:MAG: hypothetical protein BWY82_01319 [Verrucomicrobia bacterium ADurb.Bin474]